MPDVVKPERLFVGVPIAAATREELVRRLPSNLPGKSALPENWHFTLRFLGATSPDQRDRVISELSALSFGRSFTIRLDALGAFPNQRKARVIWVGASEGADRLSSIAERVESAAVRAGFEPERRKFSPHLTLSRLREPQNVTSLITAQRISAVRMTVEEVILYESRMGGPHSRYSVVMGFPLN